MVYYKAGQDWRCLCKMRYSPMSRSRWRIHPAAAARGEGANAAKHERRVGSRGRSSLQAKRRTILRAMAIMRCCNRVFASPTERLRRNSKARAPWDNVPSIPARFAYPSLNPEVCWRCRARCSAVKVCSVWTARVLLSFAAWVHRCRTGQGEQSRAAKRMWTIS